MATYTIKHLSPTGQLLGEYGPDTAYAPAFSLRVTGHGDCRNGVLNQFARLTGVRAGHVLQISLDDEQGHSWPAYVGRVAVAPGVTNRKNVDLNLAGLSARLGTAEARGWRYPNQGGTADPAAIGRDILTESAGQLGSLLSTDLSLMPDSGAEPVSVQPYNHPLSGTLEGLAARIPGGVWGVDGSRRVFLRAASTDTVTISASNPAVSLEERMVNAEGTCTAVRWLLGVGADGHPISYLSRNEALIAEHGEHVHSAQLEDGVLYLRKLAATYEVRTGTASSVVDGEAVPVDWAHLTDGDPATRVRVVGEGQGALAPQLRVYAPSGHQLDVLKISGKSNAPRISNYNAWDRIGAVARGEEGLKGFYLPWVLSTGANGVITTGGKPEPLEDGTVPLPELDMDMVEAFEIDRKALDQLAQQYYRVPALDPVAVHYHGVWLPPVPNIRVTDITGEPEMVAKVAEFEYVSRQGWWGTVIHVEQASGGNVEAQASAIAERDRMMAAGVHRAIAGGQIAERRTD